MKSKRDKIPKISDFKEEEHQTRKRSLESSSRRRRRSQTGKAHFSLTDLGLQGAKISI